MHHADLHAPPAAASQISELDEGVAAWQQLRELDLSGNQLTALPEGMCNLPRLEVRGQQASAGEMLALAAASSAWLAARCW